MYSSLLFFRQSVNSSPESNSSIMDLGHSGVECIFCISILTRLSLLLVILGLKNVLSPTRREIHSNSLLAAESRRSMDDNQVISAAITV